MREPYTTSGEALTELFLAVFRLNGELLRWGDNLVKPLGMTSARWQVLGAIALEPRRQTVADIARKMGLARQSVLHLVNELLKSGHVAYVANPAHRRAQHVVLTEAGKRTYEQVMRLYVPRVNELAADVGRGALRTAVDLVHLATVRLSDREKAK